MGIKISGKFSDKLAGQLIKAVDDGQKLEINDPEEVGQYVFTVLAGACGLVPGIGTGLSAFVSLMCGFLVQPNSIDKIWAKLRDRIEALVDAKITAAQMEILKQILKNYEEESAEEKKKARDTLKITHIAFLNLTTAAIPGFRIETYAVVSLPLFALAANIHLALLVDGIKYGKDWGYSVKNIETLRAEFDHKTAPKIGIPPVKHIASEQSHLLKEAIATATDLDIPTKIVDTWKTAYADLVATTSGSTGDEGNYDELDYVTYVNRIYQKGRGQVKIQDPPVTDRENPGAGDAAKLRAYADYDSGMIMNVLNYAEFWPYLAEGKIPESVLKTLDREIFFGPFGRYTTYATWSDTIGPSITDRGPPITSVYVRGYNDIDGLKIKYGQNWGPEFGSMNDGEAQQLDLAEDEYFYFISVWYGQKLGGVKFWNNKDKGLVSGKSMNGSHYGRAAPPGYRLTSAYITKWERSTPPGCEGLILGFRPSMIEWKPDDKSGGKDA
ncbi:hypothetical protein FVEN_g5679 [Fusarium venenatum]|uniref:Uncharacterized protein n=1 Tax=Fusarium venenatum TaxID=56646 RepID=A0A2L2TBY5_9HYPO|nr:uncharacterized protein FVRRES_04100 [Fusarium venenatum]KAG8356626.1 hypothetical protein FVEN_g5679 [Fusarium venenatum]CEI67588.1 unnamed protein product [Fusarium venenatum]